MTNKDDDLLKSVEHACKMLPEDWSINLVITKDAGWVDLVDPEGRTISYFAGEGLSEEVLEAVTYSLNYLAPQMPKLPDYKDMDWSHKDILDTQKPTCSDDLERKYFRDSQESAMKQGCSDGNCKLRIGKRPNQVTNGGCKCLSDIPTALRLQIEKKLKDVSGISIDRTDRQGNIIHVGDTLEFDAEEWGVEMTFVVELENGKISHPGSTSDLSDWCTIIKKWNE